MTNRITYAITQNKGLKGKKRRVQTRNFKILASWNFYFVINSVFLLLGYCHAQTYVVKILAPSSHPVKAEDGYFS